jgi:hypothetical protein
MNNCCVFSGSDGTLINQHIYIIIRVKKLSSPNSSASTVGPKSGNLSDVLHSNVIRQLEGPPKWVVLKHLCRDDAVRRRCGAGPPITRLSAGTDIEGK